VQSRVWRTHTAYIPTRYPKTPDPDHLIADLRTECLRRELPRPSKVRIMEMLEGPRGAVSAHMELTFAQAVKGPLLLGRDSHSGAGLFVAV
jgi:CRISPR-associated protein Csb2